MHFLGGTEKRTEVHTTNMPSPPARGEGLVEPRGWEDAIAPPPRSRGELRKAGVQMLDLYNLPPRVGGTEGGLYTRKADLPCPWIARG